MERYGSYRCIDPGGRYLEMGYEFTDDDTETFFLLILLFDSIDRNVLISVLVKIEKTRNLIFDAKVCKGMSVMYT